LPDDDDTPEEAFEEPSEEPQSKESFDKQTPPGKIETKVVAPKKEMRPDEAEIEEGDEGGGGGNGGGGGGSGGGGGDGAGGGEEGQEEGDGGHGPKPSLPISYRTFASDASASTYRVRISPEKMPKSKELRLQFWTVGDDQKAPAEIKGAKLPDG